MCGSVGGKVIIYHLIILGMQKCVKTDVIGCTDLVEYNINVNAVC